MAAVILTAVMMMGVFGTGAFAAETVPEAPSNVLANNYMRCDFTVTGTIPIESPQKFKIPKDGSYQITFDGAAGSSALVYFYKGNNSTNPVHLLTIPVYVSGMPTLSTYFSFTSGTYRVAVASASSGTTSGYFKIYGVEESN